MLHIRTVIVAKLYRYRRLPGYLGWVDLNLWTSPGWFAATVATYCPNRSVEHPKSKSTQPRYPGRRRTLYNPLCSPQCHFDQRYQDIIHFYVKYISYEVIVYLSPSDEGNSTSSRLPPPLLCFLRMENRFGLRLLPLLLRVMAVESSTMLSGLCLSLLYFLFRMPWNYEIYS